MAHLFVDFAVGDYVELADLKQADLNGEKGTIMQSLVTGRFCIQLGGHKMFRKVCVKPDNLRSVAPLHVVQEIQRCRDEGQSVASLVARGFTIAALQRDDSNCLCVECCRPRRMCSCTCEYRR